MSTFDLNDVRAFTATLGAELDRCDHGEGTECIDLDTTLKNYAAHCCQFCDKVREWGRTVFRGALAFDPAVEQAWREEGDRLFARASRWYLDGQAAEVGGCYVLEGQKALSSGMWELADLLGNWVSPRPAVGPSARLGFPLDPTAAEEARRRIDSLPKLPRDWLPADAQQRQLYHKLRRRNP